MLIARKWGHWLAVLPLRDGALRACTAVGGRRNLAAACARAFHPNSAIIFNEVHAAVPAGRGKGFAIMSRAALVTLVTALPATKKSFYKRKHDFSYYEIDTISIIV